MARQTSTASSVGQSGATKASGLDYTAHRCRKVSRRVQVIFMYVGKFTSCIVGRVGMFPAGDPRSRGDSPVCCIVGGAGVFPAGDSRSRGDTRDHEPGTPGPRRGPRSHVLRDAPPDADRSVARGRWDERSQWSQGRHLRQRKSRFGF